jgi:purine-nucleoside phosphorylase
LSPPRTLVVSAFEPEIAPLRPLVRGSRWIALAAAGIGAIDAAVGAAAAIAAARPSRVIFVGTAGVYGNALRTGLPIGSAAVVGELACVSTAALRQEAYLPAPTALRTETSRRLRAALMAAAGEATTPRAPRPRASRAPASRSPTSSVACPLAITRSAALARRIAAATGADLENLEAFAVARAAAAAGVDFAAVLGVANRVGPAAHAEWRRHHRAASRAACILVARFLGLGRSP